MKQQKIYHTRIVSLHSGLVEIRVVDYFTLSIIPLEFSARLLLLLTILIFLATLNFLTIAVIELVVFSKVNIPKVRWPREICTTLGIGLIRVGPVGNLGIDLSMVPPATIVRVGDGCQVKSGMVFTVWRHQDMLTGLACFLPGQIMFDSLFADACACNNNTAFIHMLNRSVFFYQRC